MQYRTYTCECGHKQRISEYQLGMESSCPACKADVLFAESNTVPAEDVDAAGQSGPAGAATSGFEIPQEEQPRHGHSDADHCSRCGRKFRGEWDQHESPQGPICNVCANLASQEGPGTPTTEGMVKPVQSLALDSGSAEGEGPPIGRHRPGDTGETVRKGLAERYPDQVKTAVWIGVALVFFAAIYYSFISPESANVQPEATPERVQEMEEAAARIPAAVLFFGNMFFTFLGMAGTLYLTLQMTNRLPHESLSANAVHVALMGAALMVIGTLTSFVPFVGWIIGLVIVLYILWDRYDFDLYAFVMWFVCGVLVGILVWGARVVVFGLLANALRVTN
jgi:hypothetical protein